MSNPPQSRPYAERVKHIAAILNRGRTVPCRNFAKRLEVSEKTIRRDIEFMRDRLGIPVESVAYHNGTERPEFGQPCGFRLKKKIHLCAACAAQL